MPAPPAVTLIVGDQDVLVARAVSRVVASAADGVAAPDVTDIAEGGCDEGTLLDLQTPGLFGGARVVVVRGAHALPDVVRDGLLAIAADPPSDVRLVVVHPGGQKGKRLVDGLQAAGAEVVRCAKIEKWKDRQAFALGEFKSVGRRVTDDAVQLLLDATGKDLGALAAACAQLCSDVEGTIDADAVHRFFPSREGAGFDVADRAIAGDAAGALVELRHAVSSGLAGSDRSSSADGTALALLAALARQLRVVGRVASARGGSAEVARELGLAPWAVEKAQRQGRGWDARRMSRALDAVAQAEAGAKGGGTHAVYEAERAVRTVADLRRAANP